MRKTDMEIPIDASPRSRRVIEIDANIVAMIIMDYTDAKPKKAQRAANNILEYLAHCMGQAQATN